MRRVYSAPTLADAHLIAALLRHPEFSAQLQKEATAKGVTIGAIDGLTSVVGGKIATAPFRAATKKAIA